MSDAAPAGTWCWATQAADALVALHRLTVDAATTGTPVDPKALATHTRQLRHAAHIGISQTSPRGTKLMAARHATPWPAASSTARPTTCASPVTCGFPRTTTARNATSA
ncbi:hypothetical protein [Parafrankia elaeagni]|uniref:hypothetical protein n=1 Tax=Parafrankia elaeagni TaxID=222534 RepID=UPI002DDB5319|nr:hypothetical protein [Parafrankia elaeagni]